MNKISVKLFDLDIDTLCLREAAEAIIRAALNKQKGLIVTPNVDHVVKLHKNPNFKKIYSKALFTFADGMPIVWLSKLIYGQHGISERVTGSDLVPSVCKKAASENIKLILVGGKIGAAQAAAINLAKKYPGLQIVGSYCPPMNFENSETESQKLISFCNLKQADILIFGVGAPKQELWASKYLDQLNIGPVMCVGAAIDFAAGFIKRAPNIVGKLGVEWLWRLLLEPKRLWRRYLIEDTQFLFIAIREIINKLILSRCK